MLARRARAGGGSTGATPRGRRRRAASSSARARRRRREERRRAPRARRPDFVASPERLTSTSAGTVEPARGRLGVERVARARRCALTTFALFDWRWPMKCQRNASPYSACLRLEILRAVLADDLDAGLGEHGHVVERDVLRRRDDGHAAARPRSRIALVALADRLRRHSRSLPGRRAACPVAAVREEELRVAGRAEVDALDRRRRRPRAARARRRVQRSRLPSAHDVGAERARERLRDLVADLVAARPDRRARSPPRAAPPSAATPAATIPASRPRQPACRTATAGAPSPCARARSAGSRRSARASAAPGSSRPEPVARLAARARLGAVHASASAPGG